MENAVSDAPNLPTDPLDASADTLEDLINSTAECVASHLERVRPADGIAVFRRLHPKRAAEVAQHLDPRAAASLLRMIHPNVAASICSGMDLSKVSRILDEIPPDDRVDILNHIP